METRIKHLILLIMRVSLIAVMFLITLVIDPVDKAVRHGELKKIGPLIYAVRPYLNEDGSDYKEMSNVEFAKAIVDIAIHGAKILGSDYFFEKESIKAVIKMTSKVGWALFLWNDLALALLIGSTISGAADAGPVMVDVFINGVYSHSEEDYSDVGDSILVFILGTVAALVGLAYILPYRLIVYVIRDVIGIVIGGDELDDYSIVGAILKNIGFYILFVGAVLMFVNGDKSNWIAIGVGGGIFVGGLVLQHLEIL